MSFLFTPAAQRALEEAAAWADVSQLAQTHLAALLVGVLSQHESRAASVLAQHGVTPEVILAQWPDLRREVDHSKTSEPHRGQIWAAIRGGLRNVEELLFDSPRPLDFGTEHLLLGLLSLDSPVSMWLQEQGLTVEELLADIRRWHGLGLEAGVPIELNESRAAPTAPDLDSAETPERVETLPSVLRILDASANRAREGLRVIEDYARFVLNDARLTEQCKVLRHDLAAAVGNLPALELLQSRDTEHDIGTAISTPTELLRDDPMQVARASLKRLQESLRSLEEYGKLVSPRVGAACEQLRYRSYTLERALTLTDVGRHRLAGCQLYVLIDGRDDERQFRDLVTALVGAGVQAIQLRDKRLDDRRLWERALLMRELTSQSEILFIVNDRPDLARLAQADGVHVGQEELPAAAARAICGGLVGVSTHSLAQAKQAVADGADYIGVGPTFRTPTKRFSEFPGLELVRTVSQQISLPAFAIGGITLDNLHDVLAAGCRRVAVSSAIVETANPARVARRFLERIAEMYGSTPTT